MNLRAFETEVKQNVRSWRNAFYNPRATLAARSGAAMITRNVLAARKYGLKFAEVAIRYYRVLTMVKMIVLRLDPTFDMQGELRECIINGPCAYPYPLGTTPRFHECPAANRDTATTPLSTLSLYSRGDRLRCLYHRTRRMRTNGKAPRDEGRLWKVPFTVDRQSADETHHRWARSGSRGDTSLICFISGDAE